MSDQHVWSWRQAICKSGLESTTRLVLQTLACWMNDMGGGCYPAASTIAEACGLSNRAVLTHLQKAADAGWLVINQHGFKGQKWRRNEYQAAWPDMDLTDEKGSEPASPPSQKVVNDVPEGGEPDDKKVVNDVHTNSPKKLSSNNSPTGVRATTEKTEHQIRGELGASFDEFGLGKNCPDPLLREFVEKVWVHDCKRPDEAARPAFITFGLLSEAERAAAVQAVPLYAAKLEREKGDREFRKSLKRWLAERCWIGLDVSLEDVEAAELRATHTVVKQQKQPELYKACVALKWPGDASRQAMALGWRSAMFPNEMVERARRALQPGVHENVVRELASEGQGP